MIAIWKFLTILIILTLIIWKIFKYLRNFFFAFRIFVICCLRCLSAFFHLEMFTLPLLILKFTSILYLLTLIKIYYNLFNIRTLNIFIKILINFFFITKGSFIFCFSLFIFYLPAARNIYTRLFFTFNKDTITISVIDILISETLSVFWFFWIFLKAWQFSLVGLTFYICTVIFNKWLWIAFLILKKGVFLFEILFGL